MVSQLRERAVSYQDRLCKPVSGHLERFRGASERMPGVLDEGALKIPASLRVFEPKLLGSVADDQALVVPEQDVTSRASVRSLRVECRATLADRLGPEVAIRLVSRLFCSKNCCKRLHTSPDLQRIAGKTDPSVPEGTSEMRSCSTLP